MPDYFWNDREQLAILCRYMADNGWEASEIARAVEKPWAYQDEYHAALVEDEAQRIVDSSPPLG